MPTIDYKPLANNVGAFVESQAAYLVDLAPGGNLVNGFPSGLVTKERFNKPLRQTTVMAAALATTIANLDGADVLDDGDVNALAFRLQNALTALAGTGSWTTGDVKLTLKTVADSGWIMCDDGTVGDATSGASHASNLNVNLFTLIWNNITDTWAPVVGGRGANAAADWAAHKRITMTKMLGRALALSGSGTGLTARALGATFGEENHALITTELASHTHGVTDPGHSHGITDVTHNHGVTQTPHTHTISQSPHSHSVSDPTHVHPLGIALYQTASAEFPFNLVQGATNAGQPSTGTVAGNTGAAATGISINGANANVSNDTANANVSVNAAGTGLAGTNSASTGITTTTGAGSGTAHNTMQPTSFLNAMIKI